jgi:hypothetical protein
MVEAGITAGAEDIAAEVITAAVTGGARGTGERPSIAPRRLITSPRLLINRRKVNWLTTNWIDTPAHGDVFSD